jgi:hypothetical protein
VLTTALSTGSAKTVAAPHPVSAGHSAHEFQAARYVAQLPSRHVDPECREFGY